MTTPTTVPLYGLDIIIVLSVVAFGILAWNNKLPSVDSITKLIESINTRGGNLVVLLFFSVFGSLFTIRMFYYLVQLSVDGKLQQDNAYALMGLAFLTNQLTGAFVGALLKTMTGETKVETPPSVQPTPNPQGNVVEGPK